MIGETNQMNTPATRPQNWEVRPDAGFWVIQEKVLPNRIWSRFLLKTEALEALEDYRKLH